MLTNAGIRHIKSLQQKKFRDEHGQFIAEGPKLVSELLESDYIPVHIYALESWVAEKRALLDKSQTAYEIINEKELGRISGMKNPAEVLAIINIPPQKLDEDYTSTGLNLVLCDISDPGNFGTMVRTADWFGIRQIICSKNTVELYNPKVVQATMGSLTRVNIFYTDLPEFLSKQSGADIYATVMDGENIYHQKLGKAGMLIIGNEAHGISPDILNLCTHRISIPSAGGNAESLNAAIATAVICAEFTRQKTSA